MENNADITTNIINTINTIFENLFSSIDSNLYEVLDDLIFINSDILNDKYFSKLLGTSTANGILLIANSLLIGFLLYYAGKYMLTNFTYENIENPFQFIFKCIIFGICMNSSFFIIEGGIFMIKRIANVLKKVVVAFLMLYAFNLLVSSISIYIPINLITVGVISILGIPGLLSLVALFFVI